MRADIRFPRKLAGCPSACLVDYVGDLTGEARNVERGAIDDLVKAGAVREAKGEIEGGTA